MKRIVLPPMPAVVDSKEKLPYDFGGRYELTTLNMPTGDYSVVGYLATVAYERKSIDDYTNSVTHDRPRFIAEVERLSRFQQKAIVVEASLADLADHRYVSGAAPASVVASAFAIMADYGVPVVFAGNRARAEHFVEWSLLRFWKRQHVRRIDAEESEAA